MILADRNGRKAVRLVQLETPSAAFPLVGRVVASLVSMSCNHLGASCVSLGMEHDASDRDGLDQARLQLLLFGAALGPLLLMMVLLFVT